MRKGDEARARVGESQRGKYKGEEEKKSEGATGSEESSNEPLQLRQVADVSVSRIATMTRLDRKKREKGREQETRVSDRG